MLNYKFIYFLFGRCILIKHLSFLLFLTLFSLSTLVNAQVGQVVMFHGKVHIEREQQQIPASQAMPLLLQDRVVTQQASRVQLQFEDQTVITLGADTQFEVQSFVNEESDQAQAKFNVAKGTFKTITGRIGKAAPKNFKLETPTATIGIRGTIFTGRVTKGKEWIATLRGQILVTEKQTGQAVTVNAGQITEVSPGQAPSEPRTLNAADMDLIGLNSSESEQNQGTNSSTNLPSFDTSAQDSFNELTRQTTNAQNDTLASQTTQDIEDVAYENSVLSLAAWFISTKNLDNNQPIDSQDLKSAELIGKFENFIGWGTWVNQQNDYGVWVGGTDSQKAKDHIAAKLNTATQYQYNGQVLGTAFDGSTSHAIQSSDVQLDIDFNTAQITGHINFDAGAGGNWNLNVTTDTFGADQYKLDLNGTVNSEAATGYADGSFFGAQAQSTGGAFKVDSDVSDKTAQGVFKATR